MVGVRIGRNLDYIIFEWYSDKSMKLLIWVIKTRCTVSGQSVAGHGMKEHLVQATSSVSR